MSAPVREGEILAGKFRVERVLGIGGMGVVVAARHLAFDELVALKFLLPEVLAQPEVVARFAREAQAAFRIKSEHVCRVSDVGELPNGAPYMVMEYLEGSDLASVLESRGALPTDLALEYLLQALEAVSEAHRLGIVHRDLKPANLFLTQRPDGSPLVKVLDFGISKLTAPGAGMTKTSAVMGSPGYMAPEQWGKGAEPRSDVWALGVVLYELIAGRPPFEGDTLPVLWQKIAHEPAAPLRAARPEVPEGIDAIVARCLAKEPADRFESVAALAAALAPFAPKSAQLSIERVSRVLGGRTPSLADIERPPESIDAEAAGHDAARAAPVAAMSAAARPQTRTDWSGTHPNGVGATPSASSSKRVVLLGAAALVALVVGAVGYALHGRTTTAPPVADHVDDPQASAAGAVEPPPAASTAPPVAPAVAPPASATADLPASAAVPAPSSHRSNTSKPPAAKSATPGSKPAPPTTRPTPPPAGAYNPRDHL